MPRFTYEAITASGVVVRGTSEEADTRQVIQSLRAQGLQPLKVRQEKRFFSFSSSRTQPLKEAELPAVINGLARLLVSGVTLEKALDVLNAHQNPKKRSYRLLQLLLTYVRDGHSLSRSLVMSGMLPSNTAQSVLALTVAGEQSGALGQNLTQAASMLNARLETRKNIQSALTYPFIILFVALFTLIFMGTVIAPAFETMFSDFGREPPVILSALQGFSLIAPPLLLGVALGILVLRAPSKGRTQLLGKISELALSLPLVSRFIFQRDIANFSFLLSNLLKGDVELISALKLSVSGIENRALTQKMQAAVGKIANGQPLAASFARIDGMPTIFTQLSQIGEESGTLADMLHQISENLRIELQDTLQKVTAILPTVMIILLGGMVATLVASIFGAILDINDLAF